MAANTSFITICNLSPPRLPKIHDQELLTLHWLSFWGCGRVRVSIRIDHSDGQYIENQPWHTNVNILRLPVAYLDENINVKHKTQNRRLEWTGFAKAGEPRSLTGTGPGLDRLESAGRVFWQVWIRTDLFLRSKPGKLVGYPDPLLTLCICDLKQIHSNQVEGILL